MFIVSHGTHFHLQTLGRNVVIQLGQLTLLLETDSGYDVTEET